MKVEPSIDKEAALNISFSMLSCMCLQGCKELELNRTKLTTVQAVKHKVLLRELLLVME